jgi:hypothetical protein
MTDDQRTPDLDAAPDLDDTIDATVRALTTVSDDAAAESLRRTRTALAEAAPRRAGLGPWRWAVPAVATATALVALAFWQPWAPVDAPRVVAVARPPAASAPAASAATSPPPLSARPAPVAPRAVSTRRLGPEPRDVRATSVPATTPAPTPAPDPLIALTRAVQEIPEDAWSAMARAPEPLATPAFTIAPIVVAPLVTPPIADAPVEPLAEGDR